MEYRKGSHTVNGIEYHFVWTTLFRIKVLCGKIEKKLRKLIRQDCEARGIIIKKGSITKEQVHVRKSWTLSLSTAKVVQYQKGRLSRLIQSEFSELQQKYWVSTYGQGDIFVGL